METFGFIKPSRGKIKREMMNEVMKVKNRHVLTKSYMEIGYINYGKIILCQYRSNKVFQL